MPSKSLYWHTFGSLTNALREAGFDVPVGEERLARAIEQGVFLAIRSGRLPKFADWAEARRSDPSMLTEWQVYRMFEARRGAWSTFQFLVREQLATQGVEVAPDGDARARRSSAGAVYAASWARSAHSGQVSSASSGSRSARRRTRRTPRGRRSSGVRLSSRHEIVAFSSVEHDRPDAAGAAGELARGVVASWCSARARPRRSRCRCRRPASRTRRARPRA